MNRLAARFALRLIVAAALVGAAGTARGQNVPVELIPEADQLGDQVEVIQGYYLPGEDPAESMRLSFGIYDSGASVVTLSAFDQSFYQMFSSPVPIKVPGGAWAEGVGGDVRGDVSMPGAVVSDGMHAVTIDLNTLEFSYNLNMQAGGPGPKAAVVPGVQMFVGTSEGSESLPTISGTPIHRSEIHTNGAAVKINKLGYMLDLGQMFPEVFHGVSVPYYLPDLEYVDSGTKLAPSADPTKITAPIRVPLTLLGEDNHSNPGSGLTSAPNPFQRNVRLAMGTQSGSPQVSGQTFLFDTGAMMSLISTNVANGLGLDPSHPARTMEIAGASGTGLTVNGYDVALIELPYDNGDGQPKGFLQLKNAPVFVLDIGAGIDGILGMNLFNTATEMLYDPFDPAGASLQLMFMTEHPGLEEIPPELLGSASFIGSPLYSLLVQSPSIPGVTPVPEPSTLALLASLGLAALAGQVWRKRRAR